LLRISQSGCPELLEEVNDLKKTKKYLLFGCLQPVCLFICVLWGFKANLQASEAALKPEPLVYSE
jgi:hypothetical protein